MTDLQVVVAERKVPRQVRSRALVESILDATARVLVDEGFARTTTSRVAERAGVSIGSLYQYFPSRESLVAAVARRHSERLKGSLEAAFATGSDDLQAAIRTMLNEVIRAHRVCPELTAVLSGEVPKLGAMDWKAESNRRGIFLAHQLFDQHADELRAGLDRDAAALICSTCVESVMNAAARHSPQSIEDGSIIHELSELLLRYLRPG